MTIQAGEDHIKRLSGEGAPERALVELIWNALDAEATKVNVIIERNELGGIKSISVDDDGHGFNYHEAQSDFGQIGDSWKRSHTRTKNKKRALHGSKGQGRIRGFSLGSDIRWESTAESVTGQLELTTVRADSTNHSQVKIESRPLVDQTQETGTRFTADNRTNRGLHEIDSGDAEAELLESFAPLLIAEPNLVIIFNGKRLDPAVNIHDDTTLDVNFGDEGRSAELRVIRWKSGKHKRLLFGPSGQHFLEELDARDEFSAYGFTAYVSSPVITSENAKDLILDSSKESENPVLQLKFAALKELRQFLRRRTAEERKKQVSEWKEKGVYPYSESPKTETERTERAVFDTIAGAISPHIPLGKERAKLTLELLKTSMQCDPESLNRILSEVASLSERDKKALDILLQETTLPNIIQSANTVSRRYKVLAGLERLTLSGPDSKDVKERQHLHMILENELWVFGEGYTTMTSERAVTNALREHLKLSGFPTDGLKPVHTPEGKSARLDLHFAVRSREHDRTRHLVVELKRPSVSASTEQLTQVTTYGDTIAGNPAFRAGQSEWDIVLVVSDIKPTVIRKIRDKNTGLFEEYNEPGEPHVRMFVRTWASIIAENRRRLEFMNSSLRFNPDLDEGLEHLQVEYPDFLPDMLPALPESG